MVVVAQLDGPIDPDRLAAAFAAVVARHDVLNHRIHDEHGIVTMVPTDPDPTVVERVPRARAAEWAAQRIAAPIPRVG